MHSVENPISQRGDRPRRAGPKSDDVCYNCRQTGHWASDCRSGRPRDGGRYDDRRNYRRRSYSRSQSPYRGGRPSYRGRDRSDSRGRDGPVRSKELREGRCFNCNERGHKKLDCPQPISNNGPPRRFEDRRGGDNYERRRYSRSRSPPYRGGDFRPRESYGDRRRESPPPMRQRSRSPPRDYRRDSPPRYRGRDSPEDRDYRGGYRRD